MRNVLWNVCVMMAGPPSTQLGHNRSALSNESRVQSWLCLCPCHRCEETLILELPVFKSIPVLQSPTVSSELWHSLGGCQGAFAMLWCNGLTHTLSVCRILLHYPSGFRGQSIFIVAGQNYMSMHGQKREDSLIFIHLLFNLSVTRYALCIFLYILLMYVEDIYKKK